MKQKRNLKNKIKSFLFYYLRINRRPSNQLVNFWLLRDLKSLYYLKTSLDIGCGKFINRRHFKNEIYIGVDENEDFLKLGQSYYPNSNYLCASIIDPLPINGDLVICTLVLNNKKFPYKYTLKAVKNLIKSVNVKGHLIFTIGEINKPFFDEIIKLISESFIKIEKVQYGNFNKPTLLSYPLAYLMYIFPPLRLHKKNSMFYIHAKLRK